MKYAKGIPEGEEAECARFVCGQIRRDSVTDVNNATGTGGLFTNTNTPNKKATHLSTMEGSFELSPRVYVVSSQTGPSGSGSSSAYSISVARAAQSGLSQPQTPSEMDVDVSCSSPLTIYNHICFYV